MRFFLFLALILSFATILGIKNFQKINSAKFVATLTDENLRPVHYLENPYRKPQDIHSITQRIKIALDPITITDNLDSAKNSVAELIHKKEQPYLFSDENTGLIWPKSLGDPCGKNSNMTAEIKTQITDVEIASGSAIIKLSAMYLPFSAFTITSATAIYNEGDEKDLGLSGLKQGQEILATLRFNLDQGKYCKPQSIKQIKILR